MSLTARVGFEIELLAPPGRSRLDLARAVAADCGGEVRPAFHLDAEPSKAAGVALFHHLTPAFDVVGADGSRRCRVVDDVTIQDGLDREARPEPGWWRIVTDDRRWARLAARHCDPAAPLDSCLRPLAALVGTDVVAVGDLRRVDDEGGATVAIAAPLPGERHRPCEIVTPPIDAHHHDRLEELLAPARALGFEVPAEAAVHLHVDAAPLRDPAALRDLVRLVAPHAELLRWLVGTNPRCRRLGPLPDALVDVVEAPGFLAGGWDGARAAVRDAGVVKYADLNLRNLVDPPPGKDTVEWRILPGAVTAAPIVEAAVLLDAIVRRALAAPSPPRIHGTVAPSLDAARRFLGEIGLEGQLGRWLGRQVVDVELPVAAGVA